MQQILATESRLAKLFHFSERKVRDYFKAARVSPGKYDLLQSIEILWKVIQEKMKLLN